MLVGKQLKDYLIEKEIGAGAMGTVYRAKHTATGERVAFKFISAGLESKPKALARFERETAILKALRHPNIVRLVGSGTVNGKPFYTMEYVEGETLEKMIRRRGRLEWEEVVRLGQQICAALQHAHARGVIHRDLKPANIMMDKDGTAKLMDFGIAKGLDQKELTATNCSVGTASYMSPEQCRGERDLTPKSDLYALGVMLYEMLVGRRPFLAETTLDMYLCHVEGKFERPSKEVLDIPIWLDTLVCQLLEKDANKRPYDAATVAKALDEIMEKVAARRSAGVEVATGRGNNRPRSASPRDGADREAARALKEATGKKRRKKGKASRAMLYFQAAGYSIGLAVIVGLIWWFLRPPAADALYARASELVNSANAEDRDRARQGPIADYLKHYGDRKDEETARVQRWADEIDAAAKDRALRKRMKNNFGAENDAEEAARAAANLEESGEFQNARAGWQGLEKYKSEKDPEQRKWGLLASARLRRMDEADLRLKQLDAKINNAHNLGREVEWPSEADRLPGRAVHLEKFTDFDRALHAWETLKKTSADSDDADRRVVYDMACKKIPDLKVKAAEHKTSQDVVKERLAEAPRLQALPARALYWDVIALYGKDDKLQAEVTQARKALQKLTGEK